MNLLEAILFRFPLDRYLSIWYFTHIQFDQFYSYIEKRSVTYWSWNFSELYISVQQSHTFNWNYFDSHRNCILKRQSTLDKYIKLAKSKWTSMKLNVNGVKFIDKINEDEDEREKKWTVSVGLQMGKQLTTGEHMGKSSKLSTKTKTKWKIVVFFFNSLVLNEYAR